MFVLRWQGEAAPPRRQPVTHDHAVLVFCTAGALSTEQRGNWNLQAGDVLLVPAGEPHKVTVREQPELWGIGFCVACMVADGAAALLEPFERVRAGESPVVRIPAARQAFLASLCAELAEEPSRVPGGFAVQKSLVTLILAEVQRAAAWAPQPLAEDGLVASSLRFIERNCLGPLSLKDVAAAVARSPAHVTTELKRATGRSAVEWIIAGRLAEARRRLLHTDERVDIIAERVGYADPTHLIRLFRRAHGVTPAAWRQRHRAHTG